MSRNNEVPKHPECDRLLEVADESKKIGAFLDWLVRNGYYIAEWDHRPLADAALIRTNKTFEGLLADYYEIDLEKVNSEKQAILNFLREETLLK